MTIREYWEQKVYAECCSDIELPGRYGIGVRLNDEKGQYKTVVDVMVVDWKRLATEPERRAHIAKLVGAVT